MADCAHTTPETGKRFCGSEHCPWGVRDHLEVTLRNWAAERWGRLGHLVRVGELSRITLVGV